MEDGWQRARSGPEDDPLQVSVQSSFVLDHWRDVRWQLDIPDPLDWVQGIQNRAIF